jgi:hypothetical protein
VTTPDPAAGGPAVHADDLHRMAWHMHYDQGMSWDQIAIELEEPRAAVERMASAYQQLTDDKAAQQQHTLF